MDNEKLEHLMKEASLIESEITKHKSEISRLSEQTRATRLEIVELCYGVKTGSIVKNKSGKLHRVVEVDIHQHDSLDWVVRCKPWVTANLLRKDGTYGTAVRNLYSQWELVK